MINKVVDILKNCIGRRELLYEVADSLANACRDNTENHESEQKPKRPYQLEGIGIRHINAGSDEGTQYYELWNDAVSSCMYESRHSYEPESAAHSILA